MHFCLFVKLYVRFKNLRGHRRLRRLPHARGILSFVFHAFNVLLLSEYAVTPGRHDRTTRIFSSILFIPRGVQSSQRAGCAADPTIGIWVRIAPQPHSGRRPSSANRSAGYCQDQTAWCLSASKAAAVCSSVISVVGATVRSAAAMATSFSAPPETSTRSGVPLRRARLTEMTL